jgi:hypothetical protein
MGCHMSSWSMMDQMSHVLGWFILEERARREIMDKLVIVM